MNNKIPKVYIEQRNNSRDVREFVYKQLLSNMPFPEYRGMQRCTGNGTDPTVDRNTIKPRNKIIYG